MSNPTIGFSPGASTLEDRRTLPTEDGDHEKFSHFVPKDKLTEAMVMGTPVVALCGKVWVPEPGAGEVPGVPRVPGDLGVAEARRQGRRGRLRRMTGRHPDGAAPLTPALPVAWPDRAAWGTAPLLRAWQQAAMTAYFAQPRRDFLAVATPGAGKTTFALSVAAELLGRRQVDRIVVVAPTEHLKVQWAEAAARAGIPLDPAYSAGKGKTSEDFVGVALTYAGVAANPLAMRIRTERFKTFVILDEVHHAGDALSWGEAVREAFQPAARRLALTGTPFRSDVNPIPFVTYEPRPDEGAGVLVSVPDYTYGYAHALADHVVRPVLFLAYSGDMQWRTRAGDEVAARLGEPLTKDLTAQALRTALDPAGSWMPAVLEAADRRLSEVRRHVPDAAGLVIATDQDSARAYAALLARISGEKPTVVLSDEKAASKKIAAFTDGDARWMVAVRMVSEGVDVPRLAVGVYATTTATPLFFAQAVGRFVRARKRGETASIFLPSVTSLLGFASEMEVERDHVLGRRISDEGDIFAAEQDLLNQANAGESASAEELVAAVRGARLVGRPSTGCCSTAPSSGTRARCTSGRRRRWTSSASRACSRPTRCASCCRTGRASGPVGGAPSRAPTTYPWPRTSSSRCSAASSTGWSRPGTTGPARPTATRTPRCARSAAGRRRRWPAPTSCTRASTGCASGPCGARRAPEPPPGV